MPRIRLSDALGLDVNGKLSPGARLQSILPQFSNLQDIRLDQIPADQMSLGLSFQEPLDVLAGSVQMRAGGSGGGSVALIRPERRAIDEDDPFHQIAVPSGEIYVAAALDFTARAGISRDIHGSLFGMESGHEFRVKCYRRFQSSPGGFPRFADALADTFSSFVLPLSMEDVTAVEPGTVVVLTGSGTLRVSGQFSFAAPIQPLASVSLVRNINLAASAGGSVDVGAQLTLVSGFQLRLRRTGERKVELGVYRMKSRESELSVSAEVGVSATAGNFELGDKLISALSRRPAVDAAEFRQALPGEDESARERRIDQFQSAIKEALSTKIQASVSAAFSRLRADEAAWLFEIDLDTAHSPQAANAVTAALRGDFTLLTADPELLPPGITQLINVLTASDVRKHTLRINLLGIGNILSLGQLSRVSSVERNESGEITLITDTSSANRLEALVMNLPGKAKHLRRMLSENFLIEAAYQASRLDVLSPRFRSRQVYFEIHDKTSREAMKDNLDVARVLALSSPAQVSKLLGERKEFGRTTFYVEVRYTTATIRTSFLRDDGTPRDVDEYEMFGRSALGALLAGDKNQELRLRYAALNSAGDKLWADMKRAGNPETFGPLFGLPLSARDPRIAAAGSDYFAIVTWASAMHRTAEAVTAVDEITRGAVSSEDPLFASARQRLSERMTEVVRDTHEHFGDPLGLVMVYLASNQDGECRVMLTQDGTVTLDEKSRSSQIGAAGV